MPDHPPRDHVQVDLRWRRSMVVIVITWVYETWSKTTRPDRTHDHDHVAAHGNKKNGAASRYQSSWQPGLWRSFPSVGAASRRGLRYHSSHEKFSSCLSKSKEKSTIILCVGLLLGHWMASIDVQQVVYIRFIAGLCYRGWGEACIAWHWCSCIFNLVTVLNFVLC